MEVLRSQYITTVLLHLRVSPLRQQAGEEGTVMSSGAPVHAWPRVAHSSEGAACSIRHWPQDFCFPGLSRSLFVELRRRRCRMLTEASGGSCLSPYFQLLICAFLTPGSRSQLLILLCLHLLPACLGAWILRVLKNYLGTLFKITGFAVAGV